MKEEKYRTIEDLKNAIKSVGRSGDRTDSEISQELPKTSHSSSGG